LCKTSLGISLSGADEAGVDPVDLADEESLDLRWILGGGISSGLPQKVKNLSKSPKLFGTALFGL
jgi:hypothetical protein